MLNGNSFHGHPMSLDKYLTDRDEETEGWTFQFPEVSALTCLKRVTQINARAERFTRRWTGQSFVKISLKKKVCKPFHFGNLIFDSKWIKWLVKVRVSE